jgi:CheY-like chemotaxis protein
LLVDDNVEFLEAARRLLERQGISVVAVATGSEEARRQFRELQPDVVLVDVNLGTESGFDLARELAASPSGSTTRVILISTYAEPDFGDALSADASLRFLSKSELSGQLFAPCWASRATATLQVDEHRGSVGRWQVLRADASSRAI